MTLPDVHEGDPHALAHNDERGVINTLEGLIEDLQLLQTNLENALATEISLARDAGNLISGTISDGRISSAIARADQVALDISAAIDALKAGVPAAFDTLVEISDKLGDQDDVVAALMTQISDIAANKQPIDATLTALAILSNTIPADRYPFTTGVNTWGAGTITSAARVLLAQLDVAAMRDTLVVEPLYRSVNSQTASYTPVSSDVNKVIQMNSSSATTVTLNSDSAFSVSSKLLIRRIGSGAVNIVGDGVTIEAPYDFTSIGSRYGLVSAVRRSATIWVLSGDLTPLATEATQGIVKLATSAVTVTGLDTTMATHSAGVKAALEAKLPQITTYTTPQSDTAYAIPATAKRLRIEALGGSAGGGSGRRGAAVTVRCGGGGGAGGSFTELEIDVADLGVSTLYVTVGTGGTGGAAVTTDDTNGNSGTAGTQSKISTAAASDTITTNVARAGGGGGGGGGTNATGTAGAQASGRFVAGAGGAASTTGAAGAAGSNVSAAGGGGGAGGGITTLDAVSAGGAGAAAGYIFSPQPAAGASGGGNGINGALPTHGKLWGQAGSGGGSSITSAGGNGGNGARGAGGGGGGASLNGFNSGAGGNGSDGLVRITAYF